MGPEARGGQVIFVFYTTETGGGYEQLTGFYECARKVHPIFE